MTSKKSTAKSARKIAATKRVKARKSPTFPLPLPVGGKVVPGKRSPSGKPGAGMTLVWGNFDRPKVRDWDNIPRMPNPWPPDDIVSLIRLVSDTAWMAAPPATPVYLLLKAWLDARASTRLKLKKGDVELELQGGWSERRLRKAFDSFRRLTKGPDDEAPEVIDGGKGIPPRSVKPKYKIKPTDIEAARQLEKDSAPDGPAGKRRTGKKGKVSP
jgi:hypothetical protein